MLGLGLWRQPRSVGRHEGEGSFRIVPVFRQTEMHATNQIPGGVQSLEEGLKISSRPRQRRRKCCAQFIPQREQDIRVQILRPRHHRGGQHESGDFSIGWRRHRGQDQQRRGLRGCSWGEQAQCPHISSRKVAPPDEGWRQGLTNLARPQLQKAVPSASGKGIGKPLRYPIIQDGNVLDGFKQKVPLWRQT